MLLSQLRPAIKKYMYSEKLYKNIIYINYTKNNQRKFNGQDKERRVFLILQSQQNIGIMIRLLRPQFFKCKKVELRLLLNKKNLQSNQKSCINKLSSFIFRTCLLEMLNSNFYIYTILIKIITLFIKQEFSLASYMSQMENSSHVLLQNHREEQEKSELEISKIKQAIKLAEEKIKGSQKGKNVVIFWGYTGTGKSTSIIILNGQKVYGYNESGTPIINNITNNMQLEIRKERQRKGQVVIFIEENIESGTVFPSYLPMATKPGQEKIILWDSPGFGDNKGITQILINTYYIHRLFSLQNQVKLVFTLNFNDLKQDEKGEKFLRVIKTLLNALRKFDDYEKCMTLLITKCRRTVQQKDVIKLLKDNCSLIKDLSKPQARKFVKLIQRQELSVIIIKEPNVQYQTKSNPKQITDEYEEFKGNFYKTITKLQPAKIPQLESPGMSTQDIQQCIRFSEEVYKDFVQETEKMKAQLIQYFKSKYFSSPHRFNNQVEAKSSLLKLKNLTNIFGFIQNITNSIFQKDQFDKLDNFLKSGDVLFETSQKNGVVVCRPMQKLNNLLIISNFISSIQIPEQKNVSKVQNLLLLFKFRIRQCMEVVKQEKQKYFGLGHSIYIQFFKLKISENVKKWHQERVYKKWKEDIETLPSLYLKLTKFETSKNIISYLKSLQSAQRQAGMACEKDIKALIEIHQSYSKERIFSLDEQSIVNIMREELIRERNLVQNELNFQNWGQKRVTNVAYDLPINQSTERIRNLQIKLDQKNVEISSMKKELSKIEGQLKQKNKEFAKMNTELDSLKNIREEAQKRGAEIAELNSQKNLDAQVKNNQINRLVQQNLGLRYLANKSCCSCCQIM